MPHPVLTPAIERVASGGDLDLEEAQRVLDEIMAGNASHVEIAGFLIALRAKGETADEIAGLAAAMRSHATKVVTSRSALVDIVGTGGGALTFNVSTTAAFVIAGAGCAVAKHGNRSATSKSGAADLLEALGAAIELDAAQVGTVIDELGFGFLFAPRHHAATRYVIPVRKELAVRTVFNVLGPLTSPAGAPRQVIGVGYPDVIERMADAVHRLGTERALLVRSEDGLDEISIAAPTTVLDVTPDGVRTLTVTPAELGVTSYPLDAVRGATPAENADVTRRVLADEAGPALELVVANAGAGILVGGGAATLAEGVERARAAIASGAAHDVLERFVARTNQLAAGTGASDGSPPTGAAPTDNTAPAPA
ncbi:Anthranilate phosphoribosyltransferase [Patulibacter medicamentivorans]|jgi:anthranilate phosphoribosyltransferase|uniref:Anthranilate phosphoribosyltransferase n=1 Tax=Patulibacter medicamentivorans TaxID=1097667 RepID=H0E1U7_9ACTN|nr:anthranilate phosphoribosyltransferase [Patulibacter medicamentivorans]EHN12339.1 Anthranilate phosphoribosyltransferase [Patulibacter medicamentivorans]